MNHKPTVKRRKRLGEFLYEARLRRGLTQGEVGKAVGVGAVAVHRYENGINEPPALRLLGMAQVLGFNFKRLGQHVYG